MADEEKEVQKPRRYFCPLCGSVWEWHSWGATYISMIDVPVPREIACPICAKGGRPVFQQARPVFPADRG